MAQQDEISRNDYVGNGSTTDFTYTFRILDEDHITVELVEDSTGIVTIQVIVTDYSVSGVGDSGGGIVTFTVAPATGFSIVLVRNVPFNQEVGFIENNPFPASTIERAYDKLTQIAQELRQIQSTALKPPTIPNFIDGTLPFPILPDDILQINETGDGFVTNPLQVVFGAGPLTSHQLLQLGTISETVTISEGQWDFLGDMNQGVETTASVTFASVNGATNLADIANLTSAEITQLTNIDSAVITTANWSFVSSINQALGTTDTPEFADITIGGEAVGVTTIHANQNFGTGTIETGNLTIASGTEFNLSAGSGIIVDYSTDLLDPDTTEVSWTAFSNVTLIGQASGTLKSIAIDSTGSIVQTTNMFTELELRDLILIGIVVHTPSTIAQVQDTPRKSIGNRDILFDLISILGTLNKSGNVFSANGANLNIDKTSGQSFGISINSQNDESFANITADSGQVAPNFIPVHRDGSGGLTVLPATDTIDVGFFDDGSGTLQTITANRATNHRLALAPRSGNIIFLYGQTDFSSLSNAIAAVPDPFIINEGIEAPLNIRSILSARGGASDLSDVSHAVFTEISPTTTGGPTTSIQAASLQTAYNQGETITLAATTPIDIQVNTDTDDILIGRNSSSIETFSLDGLGNIDSSGNVILDGRLTLAGLLNADVQLKITANTAQGSNIMMDVQDFGTNPIFGLFQNRTQIDKLLKVDSNQEINNVDVNQEALHITGASGQVSKLLKIDSFDGTERLSVDNTGQFLVNGAEFESGPGEVVLHYAEFDELSTTNFVDIPIPTNPAIIAMRIEIRNLKHGVPAGSTKDGLAIIFATVEDGGTFKSGINNYGQTTVTNGGSVALSTLTQLSLQQITVGGVSIFNISQSYDINVFNLRENLEDQMYIGVAGSVRRTSTISDLASIDISASFLADAGEETETINKLRIQNTFNATPNWTSGSVKVIGIKSGGPSF